MCLVILATRNPGKIEQIQAMFEGSKIKVLSLEEVGVTGNVIEDGNSLEENAIKKASFAFRHSNVRTWTMAEDTGLFIDALGGKPGIHAARWAGEEATTEQIRNFTLEQLKGELIRTAYFQAVVALISPTGVREFFPSRKVRGKILEAPRGQIRPGLPYSTIFELKETGKVFAEMSIADQNRHSHRGDAFNQVRHYFQERHTRSFS
jgi:XTP/dITP diphosphohydrolase